MSSIAFGSGNQASTNAGSANGADIVITKPASLAVGDYMLACFSTGQAGSTPQNMDLLAGWTLIKQNSTSKIALDVFGKVADASDVAAANFTFHNTTSGGTFTWAMAGAMIRWTGVDTTTPVVVSNSGIGSGTGITVTTVTPGTEPMLVLIVGGCNGTAVRTVSAQAIANNNPSWNEPYDFGPVGGAFNDLNVAYAPWAFTSATGSATATFSGSQDGSGGILLALQPKKIYPPVASSASALILPTLLKVILPPTSASIAIVIVPTISIVGAIWSTLVKSVSSWTNVNKT